MIFQFVKFNPHHFFNPRKTARCKMNLSWAKHLYAREHEFYILVTDAFGKKNTTNTLGKNARLNCTKNSPKVSNSHFLVGFI